ncbi:MAG TPA: ATP-dependent helicase, partial [Chroococcidiopsis sp.]
MSIDSSRPSTLNGNLNSALNNALNGDLHSALASTLPDAIHRLRDRLRPGQQRMADWAGGTLAVSAVPGSGKSTGMAIAAAILLARRYLHQQAGRESLPDSALPSAAPASNLILVTFTRSAAANLKLKIRQALAELSLAPQGFAVYTLHGLALTIASRYPELSGLSLDRMTLVTATQSSRLLRTCVEQWISANPTLYFRLLEGAQFDGEETERLRRQSVLRTEVLPDLAYTVIHEAKSSGLTPADLRALGQSARAIATTTSGDYTGDYAGNYIDDYNVLTIAAGLYESYQALLSQRSFIDYDDMILAALRVLDDATARALFQGQVYAVFEDEAQDSSPLQTRLLELLATTTDQPKQPLNLVRVGDPNQAINSTFTPADPVFFRQFCQTCQAQGQLAEMDQAGRSTAAVMEVANAMLLWVNQRYGAIAPRSSPDTQALEAPFRSQRIQPVAASDPQPDANPVAIGAGVEIRYPPDIFREAEM